MYVYNSYLLVKIRKLRHAIIFAKEITLFHQTMGMPSTRNQQLDKFVRAKELVFVSPYSHAMSTFVCNSLGLILWRLSVYLIRFEGQRATAINIYLSQLPHTNDLNKTYTCCEKQKPGLAAKSTSLYYTINIRKYGHKAMTLYTKLLIFYDSHKILQHHLHDV